MASNSSLKLKKNVNKKETHDRKNKLFKQLDANNDVNILYENLERDKKINNIKEKIYDENKRQGVYFDNVLGRVVWDE